MKTLSAAVIFVLLSACSNDGAGPGKKSAPAAGAPPAIDVTTPDKALKSYWAVRDWIKEKEFKRYAAFRAGSEALGERNLLARVVGATILDHLSSTELRVLQVYERNMQEVKVETESRAVAVVTIHNVTPMPAGASQDGQVLAWRNKGKSYKYVLEKDLAGWRVAEIYEEGVLKPGWQLSWMSQKRVPDIPWITEQ